ncbi:amino acid transporter-like protein [Anaeromyxobacter dehalogenans 2CP-1]|uniref:Amino acid transporter-like protein n=1 Tax=Anaeromyxobacter dehalogenans (strain ATCC BAA-258 / DSM 21875 / 2CP-1) TaxID=455488 RepID=B8JEH0_ANAD2|nr:APC family permease [Anaeromyxobacter dehalogenans]ACL64296.1 amino acid transporter-like protein [Anaeromyxobacter dehalogenans 2CP-1]
MPATPGTTPEEGARAQGSLGPPRRPLARLRTLVFGAPRDVQDPRTHHSISLVALLAWVGLGADGLSSSAYGPDEAFRALGDHRYLAVALALATATTVLVIAVAYSQIIKRFPFGGGGYVVATELLGPRVGVVSGSALLVDYVLTISVSVASSGDAIFSFLPPGLDRWKLPVEALAIGLLVVLNLRGVKESVTILAPIFGVFLVTHLVLIVGGVGAHLPDVPRVAGEVGHGFRSGLAELGALGLLAVFVRAYSMGAGTYTGIEAVSNGIQIMREPKVHTAKRTMAYMAVSLAFTAGGILVCYLLFRAAPEEGKTMNAVLLERFAGGWSLGGVPVGRGFVIVTLLAEAALLVVAAQAGFIDGPRVMANMAHDSWLPHRFGQLSDRLTIQDGVLLMGGASLATLLWTRGDILHLVTMYSINVFVTFSLSQLAMLRYWRRTRTGGRRRGLAIHGIALVLCLAILTGTVYEKGAQGGWITILVTSLVVGLCLAIRRHYRSVQANLRRLDDILEVLPPQQPGPHPVLDPRAPTAVLLVGGYGGLGVHALLTIQRTFPGHFRNFVFVSVGVIDAASMKGVEEVDRVRLQTQAALEQYVALAHRLKLAADLRMEIGTEAVSVAEKLCLELSREYPRSVVFAGKLVFQQERWYQRLLHNETAYQLQRRLQLGGLNAMVLPVRVLAPAFG